MCRHVLAILSIFIFATVWGRNPRQPVAEVTVETLVSDLVETSPAQWHQGMPFVFIGDRIGFSLSPEVPLPASDTISYYGSRWYYDSMVAEEDWMGQQVLQLRFISPDGRAYRYNTGRPMASMTDTTYHPALGSLYPELLVNRADSVFRARTLYILYNDERVIYPSDSIPGSTVHPKFVPVRIDSISIGNELSPLCVYFSTDKITGHFFTSLPGSRHNATSTSLNRFLSMVDPYQVHPDITPQIWEHIQFSRVIPDMTAEEVRLSWGRPSRVERAAARNGMIELWYYSHNRVLQIWDGRLNKIGML